MSPLFSIAASGLAVQSTRLAASAHNVANASTDGFRPVEVSAVEQEQGGVTAQIERSAAVESQVDRNIVALSQTDLVKETVGQMGAAAAFRANLAVLRTADETFQSLLDVKG